MEEYCRGPMYPSGLPTPFLWKNLRHLWHQKIPIFLIFITCTTLTSGYLYIDRESVPVALTVYEERNANDLKSDFPANAGDYIVYTSTDFYVDNLMERVRVWLELPYETLLPFNHSADMQRFMEANCKGNCFAIDFKNCSNSRLDYSMSSTAMKTISSKRYVNDEYINSIKDDDEYLRSGLLILQFAIDRSYIQLHNTGNYEDYDFEILSMPSIAQRDIKSDRLIKFGFLYMLFFNILLLTTFLLPLIEEKQNGIMSYLHFTTSKSYLNVVCFFVVRFLLYALFTALMLCLAAVYHVLGAHIPLLYIVILLFLYMLSAMTYTCLISVCFDSVFNAKVGGLLLLIMPALLYSANDWIALMANVFGTKTFLACIRIFQTFNNKYRDLNASELTTNITDTSLSVLAIFGIFLAQILIYSVLYCYLSNVCPGRDGVKRPLLSWRKTKRSNEFLQCAHEKAVIVIEHLSKTFHNPLRVVANDLNMSIKDREITILLGHNGAGKTTLLNMIMGVESIDEGHIKVLRAGDVVSNRNALGFCPQRDIFMSYMTCLEHLHFFAKLRGLSEEKAHTVVNNLLVQLTLEHKKHAYVGQLSGGMKRKLSLGIALAGNSSALILDEPSSGLDLKSRRELWDILLELRKTKAVLLTTHHMEEAEALGDTVHILGNGKLLCSGSPLELKRNFGEGYVLKICIQIEKYDEEAMLALVRRFVPNARVTNSVKPTLHIRLPYESRGVYNCLLRHLEGCQRELGIMTFSLTDATMDDVFLNCATAASRDTEQIHSTTSEIPIEQLTPHENARPKWWLQFAAIWYKKSIYLRNEWQLLTVMFALPILSVLLALLFVTPTSVVDAADIQLSLQEIPYGKLYLRDAVNKTEHKDAVRILRQTLESYEGIEVAEIFVNNITEALLQEQTKSFADFLQRNLGVLEVTSLPTGGISFRIYFSGNIYHNSAMLLNAVNNVALQWKTSTSNRIETSYETLVRPLTEVSPVHLEHYSAIMSVGMFFYMCSYMLLPFKEHVTGFSQLQAMPGTIFWVSTFMFDVLVHLLVCVTLVVVQSLLMPPLLYTASDQMLIAGSIFCYGVSYLPLLYCFANNFRSMSTMSTYLISIFVISATVPLITSGSVHAMQEYETTIAFLSLLPDFNLNHQLRIINERFLFLQQHSEIYTKLPSVLNTSYFFIVAFVTLLLTLVFLCCKHLFCNCCYCCRKCCREKAAWDDEEENFICTEKLIVDAALRDHREHEYPLLVNDLQKFYRHQAAVRGLSFAVRKGECFGLLGVNGAGKTSTFQMITANATISAGTVKIDGVDILRQEIEYRYRFGYCPQVDSLNDFMTAYQMLTYMAKLRGIVRPTDVHNEVMYWLEKLDLLKYRDVSIRFYSGGTKRKLSAAMAMICSPSLMLLDEPTTGVDPASRRFLWRCIKNFQSRDKTVVLTSHSMDECEQLCNRLGIMASGKFRWLGYVPELKRQFSAGLTINIKVKASADTDQTVNRITQQLQAMFPKCELRENHAGMLTYFIENVNGIEWSNVFKLLEKFHANSKDVVEDYSINEPTLEDANAKMKENWDHENLEDTNDGDSSSETTLGSC